MEVENSQIVKDRVVNFSSHLYENPDRLKHLRGEVSSFLHEALMMASCRRVRVDTEHDLVDVETGQSFINVLNSGIESVEPGSPLMRRYMRERDGIIGVVKTVLRNESSRLPAMVIASPPSEVYRSLSGEANSMTFLFLPDTQGQESGIYYLLYSIPTSEIAPKDHVRLVSSVGRYNLSTDLLGHVISGDPDYLVSVPVVLQELEDSVDTLAKALGYEDFNQVSDEASRSRNYDYHKDEVAKRRIWMIDYFVDEITRIVEYGGSRSEHDEINDLMRLVFAAEKGGYFQENAIKDKMQIYEYIDSLKSDGSSSYKVGNISTSDYEYAGVIASNYDYLWRWVMNNPDSRLSYEVTGCGGGLGNGVDRYMAQYDYAYAEYHDRAGLDIAAPFIGLPEESESSMKCVECPFCHHTVDAIVTSTKIKCPDCKKEVSKAVN